MMPPFTSTRSRRLVEKALMGRLGRRGRRRLVRLLTRSEKDREAYHGLVELFRLLEGSRPLCSGQQTRILDTILEQRERAEGTTRTWGLLPRLVPALAPLALIIALALTLSQPASEYAPRGSRQGQPPASHASSQVSQAGLLAFCIRQGQVVHPPSRLASDLTARCRLGDELQLMLTHTTGFSHLLVVGHQADSADEETRWYYPVPPTGRSGLLSENVIEEPLGEAIRLSVNHRPGLLRLVGVFSRTPIAVDRLIPYMRDLPRDQRLESVFPKSHLTVVELHVMIEEGKP